MLFLYRAFIPAWLVLGIGLATGSARADETCQAGDREFDVTLDSSTGSKPGIRATNTDPIRIQEIISGGLLDQWNAQQSDKVLENDLIVSVNGVTGFANMANELKTPQVLRVTVQRMGNYIWTTAGVEQLQHEGVQSESAFGFPKPGSLVNREQLGVLLDNNQSVIDLVRQNTLAAAMGASCDR